MKIVVLVKEVPDTYGDRKLNLETGLADRESSDRVLDEICERALELALSHADGAEGTEVTILTLGPEAASASIRKALAMGAASATHIIDDGLVGADLGLTAQALAAALAAESYDLVIAGNQSTDGSAGMLPAMLAERLGVPLLGNLSEVSITGERVSGVRAGDGVREEIAAALPAVISVTEQLPDARFPNFKGIMAAKKKPVRTQSLQDFGIDPEDPATARTIMVSVSERPPRAAGVRVVDDGTAAQQIVGFLTENRLV